MLKITTPIDSVTEITSNEHNVSRINSIAGQYKGVRQESKAPTFRTDLSRYVHDSDD